MLKILSFANDGDGSAGRNFVYHTSDFYINASRTALRVRDAKKLSLKYVLLSIADMKQKYGFSYTHKANKQNLAAVRFKVPSDGNGALDIDAQLAVVEQFDLVEQIKSELRNKLDTFVMQRIKY